MYIYIFNYTIKYVYVLYIYTIHTHLKCASLVIKPPGTEAVSSIG